MTENQAASTSTSNLPLGAPTTFDINRNMTDTQFRQTWTQIASAANAAYASPTPQVPHNKAYMKNIHTWSTTSTPGPQKSSGSSSRPSRIRSNRANALATSAASTPTPVPTPTATTNYVQAAYAHPVIQLTPIPLANPSIPPNPPRAPLPTVPQAYQSTYASRLKTGVTLLVQPILASSSSNTNVRSTRRGGVINYADPGSGDDIPDAGALDSDDSDFIASGGVRTSIRQQGYGPSRNARSVGGSIGVFNSTTGVGNFSPAPQVGMQRQQERNNELDQSYLGTVPPARFIKPRVIAPTLHEFPSPDILLRQAQKRTSLVPIRVEFETDTHRIRDCFVWNINETIIKPESFARIFCNDLDLPLNPWLETISNQIRAQIEEYEGVASMELGQDGAIGVDEVGDSGEEIPECRVILSIDVQIDNHHLMDHIEWDLLSPLTPEEFSLKLCSELGLTGEAVPLIAHAVHEELMKHKKDSIEWGVIGGPVSSTTGAEKEATPAFINGVIPSVEGGGAADKPRDRSGFGLLKDKTGLGLGWGRAPRDGRGPKTLRSVWRDWVEAEEFATSFEVLTAEEVEKREIERERASRRLRRETSKFQSTTRTRRR